MAIKSKIAKLLRHWADKLSPETNMLPPTFQMAERQLYHVNQYTKEVVAVHYSELCGENPSFQLDWIRERLSEDLSRELASRGLIKYTFSPIRAHKPVVVEARITVLRKI